MAYSHHVTIDNIISISMLVGGKLVTDQWSDQPGFLLSSTYLL